MPRFFEYFRVATFWSWPHVTPTSRDMAKAGFFMIGDDDTVGCMYCSTKFKDWQSDDIPLSEHKRLSPTCPIFGQNPVTLANV